MPARNYLRDLTDELAAGGMPRAVAARTARDLAIARRMPVTADGGLVVAAVGDDRMHLAARTPSGRPAGGPDGAPRSVADLAVWADATVCGGTWQHATVPGDPYVARCRDCLAAAATTADPVWPAVPIGGIGSVVAHPDRGILILASRPSGGWCYAVDGNGWVHYVRTHQLAPPPSGDAVRATAAGAVMGLGEQAAGDFGEIDADVWPALLGMADLDAGELLMAANQLLVPSGDDRDGQARAAFVRRVAMVLPWSVAHVVTVYGTELVTDWPSRPPTLGAALTAATVRYAEDFVEDDRVADLGPVIDALGGFRDMAGDDGLAWAVTTALWGIRETAGGIEPGIEVPEIAAVIEAVGHFGHGLRTLVDDQELVGWAIDRRNAESFTYIPTALPVHDPDPVTGPLAARREPGIQAKNRQGTRALDWVLGDTGGNLVALAALVLLAHTGEAAGGSVSVAVEDLIGRLDPLRPRDTSAARFIEEVIGDANDAVGTSPGDPLAVRVADGRVWVPWEIWTCQGVGEQAVENVGGLIDLVERAVGGELDANLLDPALLGVRRLAATVERHGAVLVIDADGPVETLVLAGALARRVAAGDGDVLRVELDEDDWGWLVTGPGFDGFLPPAAVITQDDQWVLDAVITVVWETGFCDPDSLDGIPDGFEPPHADVETEPGRALVAAGVDPADTAAVRGCASLTGAYHRWCREDLTYLDGLAEDHPLVRHTVAWEVRSLLEDWGAPEGPRGDDDAQDEWADAFYAAVAEAFGTDRAARGSGAPRGHARADHDRHVRDPMVTQAACEQ